MFASRRLLPDPITYRLKFNLTRLHWRVAFGRRSFLLPDYDFDCAASSIIAAFSAAGVSCVSVLAFMLELDAFTGNVLQYSVTILNLFHPLTCSHYRKYTLGGQEYMEKYL